MEVGFQAGEVVKKGAPLFVVDPRPYQADFDRARGQPERAEANLKLAQNDLDRAKDLRAKNVIAANGFDPRVAAFKQNEANTSAARAAVQTAQLNLDFCRITSPIDGRGSRERVTVGNLIQPSGGVSRNLTATDVANAIREQNVQVAAGVIGQPPVPAKSVDFQLTVNTQGRLTTEQEFGEIVLKSGGGGEGHAAALRGVRRKCPRITRKEEAEKEGKWAQEI